LLLRRHFAELSAGEIGATVSATARTEGGRLAPVAIRLIDDAEKALLADCEAHRAASRKSPLSPGAEVASFEQAVEAAKAAFAEKRRWITQESAAVHFLTVDHGLRPSGDTEPEQPAPAPAPAPVTAAKSFRGRVKLDKAEPTAPVDVLSQLADDDDDGPEDPLALLAGGN
jgi:hypothetical protein